MIHNRDWDLYSQLSAPLNFGHNGYSNETSEEASSSSQRSPNSDEDVRLASSYPKKRAGRKKFKETRHAVYRGVRQRNGNKWVCEVRTPNNSSRIWLGMYPNAEMAARAHDVAALALRGRHTCLNFADSASIMPLPASMSISDIQRKAAEVANLFRPNNLRIMLIWTRRQCLRCQCCYLTWLRGFCFLHLMTCILASAQTKAAFVKSRSGVIKYLAFDYAIFQ